jgi:hypothetical protein
MVSTYTAFVVSSIASANAVSRLRQVQQRKRLRALPAAGGHGRHPALQLGDPPLEDVGGGVHDAGVDVPELLEPEQAGRVVGPVEHVGRGGVDGHRPRVRGGIGALLPGLHGARAQAQLAFGFGDDAHVRVIPSGSVGYEKARPSP